KAAEEKYKDISEAYTVLSYKCQRKQYDAIRAMGAVVARFTGGAGGPSGAHAGGFQDIFSDLFGGGGTRTYTTSSGFGAGGFQGQGFGGQGFGDIFSQFAGGGAAGRPTKGRDIQASTTIPFSHTLGGTTLELSVAGKKVKTRIPAGVLDGQKIKIPKKGYASQTGGPPGDLILEVKVQADKQFRPEGKNVHYDKVIPLKEFLFGATVEIPTPYGETKKIKIPQGSASNSVYRIKGAGIKTAKGVGDEFVHIVVQAPKKHSKEYKELKNAV
ncbi:MAG: J domain-containing protein, partial [Bifidobacteriaceae bacterium]|nr:J domain-containing protein [Bifidobacteriaceae bacterium]